MAIFGPKPRVNPFGKMSIFRLFKLLVFILFKDKVGKLAIFGPKLWVNPFGKMASFQRFDLLVFIA